MNMNIINSNNQNYNNIKFRALPIARYKTDNKNFVKIYQLEKKDISFVSQFFKNIKNYFINKNILGYSRQEVMKEAFAATEKILSLPEDITKKSKVLIAVKDSNPCGILIANVPKKSKSNKIVYSSRKNHSRHETELDWLVTWNPFKNKKIKGVGKVITNEYFNTIPSDNFKSVYVRSEVPELSSATDFYKRMGFDEFSKKRDKIIKSSSNKYLIGNFDASDEEIVPMVVTKNNLNKTRNEINKNCSRLPLDKISVNIENIL